MFKTARHFYTFGPYKLDPKERTLFRNGARVKLPPKATETLLALVENGGRLVVKEELIARVWPDTNVEEGNLAQQIRTLRKELGDREDGQPYIETLPRRGYCFSATAAEIWEPPPETLAPPLYNNDAETRGQVKAEAVAIATSALPSVKPIWTLGIACLGILAIASYSVLRPARGSGTTFTRVPLTADGVEKFEPIFVNGQRIYFREHRQSSTNWVSVSMNGGDPVPLQVSALPSEIEDVRADGEMLIRGVGAHKRELWIKRNSRRAPELLDAFDDTIMCARFSPKGSLFALATSRGLFLAEVGGGRILQRFPTPGLVNSLAWSPNGNAILFRTLTNTDGGDALWEASSDGSGPWLVDRANLPRAAHGFTIAGWLNGRALLRNGDSQATLWLLQVPRFPWISLPPSKPSAAEIPNCDSGGARANLETIYALCGTDRGELVLFDQASRQWLPAMNGIDAYEIDYSRDGEWIAYTRSSDSTIWFARADGSQPIRVSKSGMDSHFPHWAPDSFNLAFMAHSPNGRAQIYLADRGGSSPKPLGLPGEQGVPNWSMDGQTLLWGDLRRGQPDAEMAIHAMDLHSKELWNVPGSNGMWSPRMAPDGQRLLAFTPDFKSLMVASLRGASMRRPLSFRLAAEVPDIMSAEWSRDSRSIYVLTRSHDPLVNVVLRVDVQTMRAKPFADALHVPWCGEPWVGSARDGSLIALRRSRNFELYRFNTEQ